MVLLMHSNTVFGVEDTVENRNNEADRYISVTPPKELLQDVAKQMALNYPPEKRELFIKIMTQYLDIDVLTKSMKDSMIKIFTADELAAMADYYGSSNGLSATKKMGAYMAEIMPTIQAEALKAVAMGYKDIKGPEEKEKTE
jgi:hypothetical protein